MRNPCFSDSPFRPKTALANPIGFESGALQNAKANAVSTACTRLSWHTHTHSHSLIDLIESLALDISTRRT